MTNIEITHITMITTTLMIVKLRFSYLHSQRGQNSCSFPLIFEPIFGKMTPSQLLKQGKQIKKCL